MASGTKTANLAALLSDHAYASITNPNNPIGAAATVSTYAQVYLTTGANAETYFYYAFDLSDIPQNAQITSVACSAKGYISYTSASYITARQMQLYSGTTAKGQATNLTTTASTVTMTAGTWTRQELNDCRIRLYAKRGTSGATTNRYIRFYGAEITVNYTYQDETYTITTSVQGDGTISPSGETTVQGGATFTATITPDENSTLIDTTMDGNSIMQLVHQVGNVFTLSVPDIHDNHNIVAFFGVEGCASLIESLITDRESIYDIYGYTDINRVTDVATCVSEELSRYGYQSRFGELKNDWSINDYFYGEDAEALIYALDRIKNALATKLASGYPSTFEDLTFDGANRIEQFLLDIDALIAEIIQTYPQSGMYEAGEIL